MGIFFYTHSVALAEDLIVDTGNHTDIDAFYTAVDASYQQVSISLVFSLILI